MYSGSDKFWFNVGSQSPFVRRLQLIDDLSYEDVKKCYRGSVSLWPTNRPAGGRFKASLLFGN